MQHLGEMFVTKPKKSMEEIEYEKMKLHMKYMIGLIIAFIGIIILLIGSTKEVLILKIYFISTCIIILLSIIAIIITILGWIKINNYKNKY